MKITAQVSHSSLSYEASLGSGGRVAPVSLPVRSDSGELDGIDHGVGERRADARRVDGRELLMLALATCYCNEVRREAALREIPIDGVEVEATADFEREGCGVRNIRYSVRVASPAPERAIAELLRDTDAIAEVHNTVRSGVQVSSSRWEDDAA